MGDLSFGGKFHFTVDDIYEKEVTFIGTDGHEIGTGLCIIPTFRILTRQKNIYNLVP